MKHVDKNSESDIEQMKYRAIQIANHYDEHNRQLGRKGWGLQDYADGLVGDIGDLMKAIMVVRERRDGNNGNEAIEHELNDIMWSLLMLYYFLRIDPKESFTGAMDILEDRVINMKEELKDKVK